MHPSRDASAQAAHAAKKVQQKQTQQGSHRSPAGDRASKPGHVAFASHVDVQVPMGEDDGSA